MVHLIDTKLYCFDECKDFYDICEKKRNITPELICLTENSLIIKPFITQIFDLKYFETPDYDKLKWYLIKELLNFEQTPSDDIFGQAEGQPIKSLMTDD